MPADFNQKTHSGKPASPDLRIRLIDEEARETIQAIKDRDVVEIIDGLCDLLYVTYGAAARFDVDVLDDMDSVEAHPRDYEQTHWMPELVDWKKLVISIPDLTDQVNLTAAAIKAQDKDKMTEELSCLAIGCWDAGFDGLGIDLRPFFLEVHRTNMHKLQGPKREDGKQLKPAGWTPPRISTMLDRLKEGKAAACHLVNHEVVAKPHDQGGEFCATCGGLLVDWRE